MVDEISSDDNPGGGGEGLALEKYRSQPVTSRIDLGVPGDNTCGGKIYAALDVILKKAAPELDEKAHYRYVRFIDGANENSKISIELNGGNGGHNCVPLIGIEESQQFNDLMALYSEGKAVKTTSSGMVIFNSIGDLNQMFNNAATQLGCRAEVEAAIQGVERSGHADHRSR